MQVTKKINYELLPIVFNYFLLLFLQSVNFVNMELIQIIHTLFKGTRIQMNFQISNITNHDHFFIYSNITYSNVCSVFKKETKHEAWHLFL